MRRCLCRRRGSRQMCLSAARQSEFGTTPVVAEHQHAHFIANDPEKKMVTEHTKASPPKVIPEKTNWVG
jgi:hypothetical protein